MGSHNSDDWFDWTGFYRVTEPKVVKTDLYQGGHGCLRFPFYSGISGQATSTGKPSLVNNFGLWKTYSIFPNTKSKIVLLMYNKFRNLIALPDIDSDLQDAFDNDDTAGLLLIINSIFLRNLF